MRAHACDMVDAIHNDGQHTVTATRPFVHLGFCDSSVTPTDGHDLQDVLCTAHWDLYKTSKAFKLEFAATHHLPRAGLLMKHTRCQCQVGAGHCSEASVRYAAHCPSQGINWGAACLLSGVHKRMLHVSLTV